MDLSDLIETFHKNAYCLSLVFLSSIAFVYGVGSWFKLINDSSGIPLLLALLSGITFYLICTRATLEKEVKHLESVDESIKSINLKFKSIIVPITKQSELYTMLEKEVVNATRRVYLMHLDSQPPTSSFYGDHNRSEYFDNCLQKAQEGRIKFRRIVNIENEEMLIWVKKLIEDTSLLLNYQIAYIQTGSR